MLRFIHEQRNLSGSLSRREWLRIGGLGLAALAKSLSGAEQTARKPAGFGKAKSVILVFANGGQSQIDMWDPKPAAPLDVRGRLSRLRRQSRAFTFPSTCPKSRGSQTG